MALTAEMKKGLYLCVILNAVGLLITLFCSSSLFYTPSRAQSKDMTQRFLEACRNVGLNAILMDGDLLRKGGQERLLPQLDLHRQHAATFGVFATFGVIDPPNVALEELSQVFSDKTKLFLYEIQSADPRNVLASSFVHNPNLNIIPMHFLWWTPVHDFGELRIHLVVFRSRAGYLWYDNMFPSPEPNAADRMKLPFWMPRDSIGQKAALIDRFATREDTIGGMNVSVPANMTDFRFRLQHGLVAECNHVTAKRLVTRYRASQVFNPTVRKRVLQILNITARTLDRLGLPFWLSAGTLLGWYRQCDVVPYTNDVDIEMRIQDYTPKMTEALVASGLKRLKQIGKVEDGFQLRFGFGGIFIDIFFCYEEQDHVWWNMFSDSQKYRYVFPKYSLRWTEFGGLRVRVPYPVEMYLTALYGQEWSKPVRVWNWLMGPRNKVPAGFWSKEDLPTVDIEF